MLFDLPTVTGSVTQQELLDILNSAPSIADSPSVSGKGATVIAPSPTGGENLIFDATLSETHRDSVITSRFPTDRDSVVQDHAYKDQQTLSLQVFVTDQPVSLEQLARTKANRAVTAQSLTDNPLESAIPMPGRSQQFYDELRRIQNEFLLVSVVTGLRVYSDMLITNLSVSRSAGGSKHSLRIDIKLKKIRKVTFRRVLVSEDAFASDLAEMEADRARRAAREVEESAEAGAAKGENNPSATINIFRRFNLFEFFGM